MAIFTYYCKQCQAKFEVSHLDPELRCELGHKLKRVFIAPALHVKEYVDNGFQIKRVEKPSDSVDLFRQHNESLSKKN